MRRVVVHIDRLVLKGLRAEDRRAIADSLERELGRELTATGAVSRLRGMENMSGMLVRCVSFDHDSKAQLIGESVAQAIGMEIRR